MLSKPRLRCPSPVPIEYLRGCREKRLTKYCRQLNLLTKNAPGLSLALDEEFQAADCFSELTRGYTHGVVDPYIMMGLQPTGPTRVNLEVIVPSPKGLTPEMWKQSTNQHNPTSPRATHARDNKPTKETESSTDKVSAEHSALDQGKAGSKSKRKRGKGACTKHE